MIVTSDISAKLMEAYRAGQSAAAMHGVGMGPKPDAKAWLAEQNRLAGKTCRG